ncbi:MAG: DUF2834 domain-containing protein [Bacteroidota bacterium]
MKRTYLLLSLLGFALPNILVFIESIETGNILLYAHPLITAKAMFANRISSIFMIDLLFTLGIFFFWSFQEAKRNRIEKYWISWICTLLFGLAGGFPLFLYQKEKQYSDNLPTLNQSGSH